MIIVLHSDHLAAMKGSRGGFRVGRSVVRLCRGLFRLRSRHKGYTRLSPWSPSTVSDSRRCTALAAALRDWGRRISFCFRSRAGDRASLLEEEGGEGWRPPPKGYLAVYVGGGWEDGVGMPAKRYVVPVVYFKHPLFRELLREAEEEFGFCHPGGITIPCPAAEFERVRTRIAAARHRLRRKNGS